MASNAKNLAELLNTDSTVAVADVADGSITTAKLASGAVTTVKIADDAVTSAKAVNSGRRNLIINGAMQVAQRGNSATGIGITPAYNTVDRWRFADINNPTGRFTETQSTDAPEGFGFSRKFEVTTIDGGPEDNEMQYTDHFIEAQNLQLLKYGTSNAESVTLSFYVKSSVASTMGVRFTHEDGGGSYGAVYTINATNTWERKTITVPGNTSTAINNDKERGLRIAFGLNIGADNAGSNSTAWGNGSLFGAHTNTFVGTANATWQVTGVQLEVGSSASDFEHLSFAEELALCQRYFQNWGATQAVGSGVWYNASQIIAFMPFHKIMRDTPTMTTSSDTFAKVYLGGSTTKPVDDSTPFDLIKTTGARMNLGVSSNGTSGHGAMVQTQTSAYVYADAEL